MKFLVTGANGFVGRALCTQLLARGFEVRGAVRSEKSVLPQGVERIAVGEIHGDTDWSSALQGIDIVIHLAARVHVMKDESSDPLSEFRKVNVEGTEKLAISAARAGVERLVYASSIKVNGEATTIRPYSETDASGPQDPYGVSKWEAERMLHRISKENGIEFAIIRPPLVYGPGVGGNFIRMLDWIAKGIPLPLGSVKNRRSMIYVENLADALILCSTHPDAANQTYLVSDNETVSTPELLERLSAIMGRRMAIPPFPVFLLDFLGKIAGKSAELQRLTGSLEVDASKIRKTLAWNPPSSLDTGLTRTVDWFSNSR